ncbi:hypothetical protein J6524_02330 [Bradyrhizobium sp. WSM 1738]|uniref:hypothetical protein n=1 Tax=Bradyrhizobium hereditatis TaxID=2821405 RepID=UPI001CE32905|nr:hypothetical protein [Bradyrhizobium hereditatis]MCA6113770.1 hypothetical protein [Bradyrhizobium hereditatis]
MASKRNLSWALAIAGVVGYFALATYFERTHKEPKPTGKVVLLLKRPFHNESGFAYRGNLILEERRILTSIAADDPKNSHDISSPIQLYEDQAPVGPGHSTFEAISKTGLGHFAYWTERGIFFSTSDNSDPNHNGRRYWVVVP